MGLRQSFRSVTAQRVARTESIPAPVGGLNVRDSIANMPEEDAVILTNFFCLPSDVRLRKGYIAWTTGITGITRTITAYNASTQSKLFASAGNAPAVNIYDISASGAVGAPVVTGQTSAAWQTANVATPGGDYQYWVNGVDPPQLYDGVNWQAVTGVSAPIAITGVTTSNLIHVNLFARRLWFVEKNTLKVWYLPVDSIGGAAQAFNLTELCSEGGYLMAMYTWTLDAGQGMDDRAVFITSQGQVLVYQGTDPAVAATFALVGTYFIGRPIGRRCGTQYGSDLLIICEDGLFPLSRALLSSRVTTRQALTDKIQSAISEAITLYGTNFGWQTIVYPQENMIILNVPLGESSVQYVMNTITGAWALWTNLNAYCWEEQDAAIYFGANGKVFKAWVGASDPTTTGVANINGEALQAFSKLGSNNAKAIREARVIVAVDNPALSVLVDVNVDYDQTAPTGLLTFPPSTAGVYGTAIYGTSTYGGGLGIVKDWRNVTGLGYTVAMHILIATQAAEFHWQATDYLFEIARGL